MKVSVGSSMRFTLLRGAASEAVPIADALERLESDSGLFTFESTKNLEQLVDDIEFEGRGKDVQCHGHDH